MIAEAIAGANPNSYMGFVNTLDAPQVMFSNAASLRWLVCRLPAVEGGDEDDDDFGDHVDQIVY